MADNHVLEERAQLRRKIGYKSQLVRHNAEADHHVAQELAFGRVSKTPVVAQFIDFADVVQHGAREQEVKINAIMLCSKPRQLAQREHVLEQTTEPCMMNLLCGRCAAKTLGDL